jgi:hypothetical protein
MRFGSRLGIKMVCTVQLTVACAALIFSAGHASASMIDTTPSWTNNIGPFGEDGIATFGQTFTVTGPDTVLTGFTYWLDDFVNPDAVDFAAYVMAWNSGMNRAMGPVLFQSAMLTTTNNSNGGGWEQFTINTGSIALVSGLQYVAFFSTSSYFDGVLGAASMGFTNVDSYTGGQVVSLQNGSNTSQWTSTTWSTPFAPKDLAFQATFSAPIAQESVPEPSSLALLGIGGVGMIVGVARRRRARRAHG